MHTTVHDLPPEVELAADIQSVRLDITKDCNLRCIYCTRSQPDYVVKSMSPTTLQRIISELDGHSSIEFIEVNGHGETTVHPDWAEICFMLMQSGRKLSMTSNFAKIFSPAEVRLLSRLLSIVISIDTSDRKELMRLRRKVDLRTILLNMTNIRTQALKDGHRPPDFGFSCGLYDQNVMGVEDLARLAVVQGVRNIIFWNLTKHPDLPDQDNPQPLATLADPRLRRALACIDRAGTLLQSFGIGVHFGGDFVRPLGQRLDNGPAVRAPQAAQPDQGNEPMTRCCTNPWRHVEFMPGGEVSVCCDLPPKGNITRAPLSEIRNGEHYRTLRRSLLSGDLLPHCQRCPVKSWIPVSEFRKRFLF